MKRRFALMLALVLCVASLTTQAGAWISCSSCVGKGWTKCNRCSNGYRYSGGVRTLCGFCGGSGKARCLACGGDGRLGSGDPGPGGSGGSGGAVVALSDTKLTLVAGRTAQLKMKGTGKTVKWSTSNKAVATVSAKGKVTAKKAGKANITAKVGSKKYVCKVTVKKKVYASSITLSGAPGTLLPGETAKLTGTVSPAASKITEKYSVSWSSDNAAVASVDNAGNVTAHAPGSAVITATLQIKKGKTKKASRTVSVETGLNRLNQWFAANAPGGVFYTGERDRIVRDYAAGTWTFVYDEGYEWASLTFNDSFTGDAQAHMYYQSRFGTGLMAEAVATAPANALARGYRYNWTFLTGKLSRDLPDSLTSCVLSGMQVFLKENVKVGWKDLGLAAYE